MEAARVHLEWRLEGNAIKLVTQANSCLTYLVFSVSQNQRGNKRDNRNEKKNLCSTYHLCPQIRENPFGWYRTRDNFGYIFFGSQLRLIN